MFRRLLSLFHFHSTQRPASAWRPVTYVPFDIED